jgi:hypothetical protein
MSGFDGSGDFVIGGTGLPFVTNTTISSTVANQLNTDIANGLSNTICKDGQSTPTNDIPMGGFRVTDVGDPTAPGDVLTYGAPATISDLTVTGDVSLTQAIEQNLVLAGPIVDPAAPPTFRLLAPADIPFAGMTGKNRLINGDMRIDQRNNGAAVTMVDGSYNLDRWRAYLYNPNTFSVQQTFGKGVGPPGAGPYYLSVKTLSPSTIVGANLIMQLIELQNTGDFQFGTANALPLTLSFLAYSSYGAGLYGGAIFGGGAVVRNCPFQFNLPNAVWTKVVVTIPGDVSNASDWSTPLALGFNLGAVPARTAAPGVWASVGGVMVPPGCISPGALSGELDIRDVQLEIAPPGATPANPIATPFERRQYGTELMLCQRYYQTYTYQTSQLFAAGQCFSASSLIVPFPFQVPMRTAPTASLPAVGAGAGQMYPTPAAGGTPSVYGTLVVGRIDPTMCRIDGAGFTGSFAAGQSTLLSAGSSSATLSFSAEL